MPQPLSSKEKSLFRHLVEDYEAKQYKKGLKTADQILRKSPKHGDTQAMKALILNSMGQNDEAFTLAKESLKNDMKSQVCWHVYGLLWRSVRNYEEAIKAYRFALKFEPESAQVLRDLALLQVQMRDYQGYVKSRQLMMQARPAVRQNWTALAVAHHLAGDLKNAESILVAYENTLKQAPPKSDIEHQEAVLYKNTVIAEQGELERALEHLESISKDCLDRVAIMELRAKYLLQLGKKTEAEKAYGDLLLRNAEYRAYYEGLEKARGLNHNDNKSDLKEMYSTIAQRHDRIDAARRIPLDFLQGADFKEVANAYLQAKLSKGVPSTFNNVKSLYVDQSKLKIIQDLVESFKDGSSVNGVDSDNESEKRRSFQEAVLYFLAQHYNYSLSRDLKLAEQYTEELIKMQPKTYDYVMMRARIQKHLGNPSAAAKAMNEARELDLKDRYINTKCAKYQLRNNDNETALKTMSAFTRNEAVGGTLGDLVDMQSIWYLTEDAEAHLRRGDFGLALKRFHTIFDIYETWQEDQFDFHTFSFRKGQIRAYVDMILWEDVLRDHPFYSRAAIQAAQLYTRLHDDPTLAQDDLANGLSSSDPKEVKKAKKEQERRERIEAEQREAERKAAAAKKANPPGDGDTKKPDEDPKGKKLLATKDAIGQAFRFIAPVLELDSSNLAGQHAGFEVHFRRQKYLLALKCLLASFAIDSDDATAHVQAIKFLHALKNTDSADAKEAADIANVALPALYKEAVSDLKKVNESFAASHATSLPHALAAIKANVVLDGSKTDKSSYETEVVKALEHSKLVTLTQVLGGFELLRELKASDATFTSFAEVAKKSFPDAQIVEREADRRK